MNNYQPWEKYHGRIVSSRGGWKIGSGVQNCGYDMMTDLVGKVSYMQVVVLNATGRLPSKALADWIEAVHICLSWPDPRIWCNRIGALAGSSRASGVAASCLGVLAAESTSYGIKPLISGVEFIEHALTQITQGTSVDDFISEETKKNGGKPNLMGYARPIAKGDERIPAMEEVTKRLGFPTGENLSLAYKIEKTLHTRYDESMNINGYVSAFLVDQGFSAIEVYRIFSAVVFSGVTACYTDTADRIEGSFAPLKTSDVIYKGSPLRTV
jgi:citrate synthase